MNSDINDCKAQELCRALEYARFNMRGKEGIRAFADGFICAVSVITEKSPYQVEQILNDYDGEW